MALCPEHLQRRPLPMTPNQDIDSPLSCAQSLQHDFVEKLGKGWLEKTDLPIPGVQRNAQTGLEQSKK